MDESGTNLHTLNIDGVPNTLSDEFSAEQIARDRAEITDMEKKIRELDKETTYNQCRIFYEKG
jgi:hypothetical protein